MWDLNTLPEQNKICRMYSTMLYTGVAGIFPWRERGEVVVLIEKCSLLVDRLRRISERYIEVEQLLSSRYYSINTMFLTRNQTVTAFVYY